MKVLLVEDDVTISRYVREGFLERGHELVIACASSQALKLVNEQDFDIIILDLMLPKVSGFEILTQIRHFNLSLPIIILSAIHSVQERIKGFELGADDYLTKPFSFQELLARCSAITRRSQGVSELTEMITGELKIDFAQHTVTINKRNLNLAEKEYKLLALLIKNKGEILSKARILDHVWNYQFEPQTNIVDVLVCRLRNKLADYGQGKRIETVRGVGYAFK